MQSLSLYAFNGLLKEAVHTCFPDRYWIHAELSEVRESAAGHGYLELVEKGEPGASLIARAKGVIWAGTYRLLQAYFERETGVPLAAGIKVQLEVSPEFHELYGYSLVVHDIDPAYTVGDLTRRRREILDRLAAEGVRERNRELPFPLFPQRIAVISSRTAAGFGDFSRQLAENAAGYRFYPCLFQATMQGARAEESLLAALERIRRHADRFDLAVVIRGGGATSELSCFDSYPVAEHIARFPLPVVVGIGHDRDETVLDRIASRSVKTPTAAAQLLIDRTDEGYARLLRQQQALGQYARRLLEANRSRLEGDAGRLASLLRQRTTRASEQLSSREQLLQQAVRTRLREKKMQLEHLEERVRLLSPQTLLERGYTLTLREGRILSDGAGLRPGDLLTTLFRDGAVDSEVTLKKS